MHAITRRIARRVRTALGACGLIGGASAALVAGAPRPAAAQSDTTAATAPALRLGDAYSELASHNPRVAAARALAAATNATVRSASLPPDPQVQLGFMNYALPDLRPMAPLGMVQLQIMQMIPLPGKLGLAGGAAQARSDAAHDLADGTYWTARTGLADAFYDLYRLDAQLGVARRTIALLGDIEQTAQAMYWVGEASQPDVLRAQVEMARMTEDTLRMVAMRSAAAARFNADLDRTADTTRGAPVLPAFPDAAPSLDSLLALAVRDRPLVQAGRAGVTAAERQRDLAARDAWPDLAVGVQLGRRPGGVGNLMGSLMVGASLPVFMSARQGGAREAAAAMAEMSRADLRATEADTRASVFTAYADLLRARRLTALYRNTVLPQAGAAATSALASYRVGHVDFMTVLDDRMTVNRYEQDLHQLESDEGKAWAQLEALVARTLINANSTAARASGGSR